MKKVVKRILTLVMALALVVGGMSIVPKMEAQAADKTAVDANGVRWLYYTNDDGTVTIKSVTNYGENLLIPSTLDGMKVKQIGDGYGSIAGVNEKLKTVIVGNGIQTLASFAFQSSQALVSISIPETVTGMYHRVFHDCTSLKTVNIPKNITEIGSDLFLNCYSLAEIDLPAGLTVINGKAFQGCSSLKTIQLPNSLTSIGESAFEGSGLVKLTIPENVTWIGRYAFQGCPNLTSVVFNATNCYLESDAFRGCNRLISFNAPNGMKEIGTRMFSFCDALTEVDIPAGTAVYNEAFMYCKKLSKVTIRENVTISNDRFVFGYCPINTINLAGNEIPNALAEFWSSANIQCNYQGEKSTIVAKGEKEAIDASPDAKHTYIKGQCQLPYAMVAPGEPGYLIGFQTYETNPDYRYEMMIYDCTAQAWVYRTGEAQVPEDCFWTVWQPEYGYFWTLFVLTDVTTGEEIDRVCYGFQNICD